ncbi:MULTISPECIES: flagellar filament capping protein FliD [Sphingomonas]|uniref:flagellar filament capping protein FliD n=1 Tax=Edaphosphingomonas fennica TaxID=114404 RepID=UPI001475FFA5|nr:MULTISPECIES: flagellar filament capping protein FliD [Sphingomonas]MDX3885716.1 flagellar filament capping protein FliD [Sphingomonas sp.]
MTSIASTLGVGSGIDTATLVEQLAAASKKPKEDLIAKREEANSAKISALGNISSAIDSFASALSSLISGGSLFTQATSSDTGVVAASALAGSRIGNLSVQMEVRQLAAAQSIASGSYAGATSPIGQGQMTLTTAKGSFAITVDAANDSLAGLARAINAAGAGVTASVIQDTTGSRLVIKGATGAAQAFSLSVDPSADAGLQAFAFDPASYDAGNPSGMSLAQAAQDAIVRVDGVEVTRTSNSFSDLVPGVKIDLRKAAAGTVITIGSSRPTAAISQAVSDFVAAYNELKSMLDAATAAGAGALRGDVGLREMQRQLAKLPTTVLSSAGGPATLAEIGVRTQRDGTLAVDGARLASILASDPDGVEALFNPGQTASSPLIRIVSPYGAVKPGTYTVSDLVAGDPASGKIEGFLGVVSGSQLSSSIAAKSKGLVIEPLGNLAEGTITVDLGLGGALQAIRDALRASGGPLATTQARLATESKTIAKDREKMETRESAYHDQLVRQFTAMDSRVAAFKATQSYLDQQIKMWTSGNN